MAPLALPSAERTKPRGSPTGIATQQTVVLFPIMKKGTHGKKAVSVCCQGRPQASALAVVTQQPLGCVPGPILQRSPHPAAPWPEKEAAPPHIIKRSQGALGLWAATNRTQKKAFSLPCFSFGPKARKKVRRPGGRLKDKPATWGHRPACPKAKTLLRARLWAVPCGAGHQEKH